MGIRQFAGQKIWSQVRNKIGKDRGKEMTVKKKYFLLIGFLSTRMMFRRINELLKFAI